MKIVSGFAVLLVFVAMAAVSSLPAATLSVVANFPDVPTGANPSGNLVLGNDGNFYGVTKLGGLGNEGAFFKMTPSGTITMLASFLPYSGPDINEGSLPTGLILGNDGNFYGTTQRSVVGLETGTVFGVTPSGVISSSTLTALSSPPSGYLVKDKNGYIYGGSLNGTSGSSAIFSVNNGLNFYPIGIPNLGPFVVGNDGNFYGVTTSGGTSGVGTLFKLTSNRTLTTLLSFNTTNGASPSAFILGSDGNFYGTTSQGGSAGLGTVFKATSTGSLTTLAAFTDSSMTGSGPESLIQGADGNFYGLTASGGSMGGGTAFKVTPQGMLTVLASFSSGSVPGGLVQGPDGSLYGTTSNGGNTGVGTAFKISLAGELSVLASFSNGAYPYGGLVQGDDGNFYGTTYFGGATGNGRVFKVSPAGVLTTVASFSTSNPWGYSPAMGLIKGSDGNFYGGTTAGNPSPYGNGGIFQMTPDGTFSSMGSFNSNTGINPVVLCQGNDGNLYGAATSGGTGAGTIFKVNLTTKVLSLVAAFGVNGIGSQPSALVQGNDGYLYGTTLYGGPNLGTAFALNPVGTPLIPITTLASFTPALGMGEIPVGITLGQDGNFYGSTEAGYGSFFKMTPAGSFTNLATFSSAGHSPQGPPVQGSDGNFYGTTSQGGDFNLGTVFQVTPGGALTHLISFNTSSGANILTNSASFNLFTKYLVQGADGKFYGVTPAGGPAASGLIFAMDPAGTFGATYGAATDVPATNAGFTINNTALSLTLNYAPTAGTVLTVINNTGTFPIYGKFSNLAEGGIIAANYNGVTYSFSASYVGGDGNDMTLTLVPQSPFLQWAELYFSPQQMGDPTVSGAGAIAQNDGVSNLLKYLCDIKPNVAMSAADRAALPVVGSGSDANGEYLTLTYRQNSSVGGMRFEVEKSTDLVSWTGVAPGQVVGTDPVTNDPIIETRVSVGGASRMFVRLHASLP